jgi:peroxiredoxin Q/BCP
MLKIGTKAPKFNLESSSGGKLSNGDLKGSNAVIVFYPRNNTPGCNIQLARLEKARTAFEKLNTKVLAINSAGVESHQKYCQKKNFNFPILSDPGEKILASFKAQKEKGKGVMRTVYAIDKDGKVISAVRGMGDFKELQKLIKESSN